MPINITGDKNIYDDVTNMKNKLSAINKICVGSQVIYSGPVSGEGNISKTPLLGSYDYSLINGIFSNVSVLSGWHKEYRLSFQGTTGGGNTVKCYLNNISTDSIGTWSSNSFRVIGTSGFFKESDIILETTYGYSSPGINLYYEASGTASSYSIYNVTVSGFLALD